MFYISPENKGQENEFGQTIFYTEYWNMLAKITNVLCEDGKIRVVWITSYPDTFFSIPARVKVKGKTVTGFVTRDDEIGYKFIANSFGKNGHLLQPACQ